MKKFNKKTLIIGLLIFIGVVILVFSTFAQQWVNPKDINPPTSLIAEVQDENDVNLFWTAPSTGDSTYLHWDNGVNYTSFGNFLQPVEQDYAAKWDPDHITGYDGWTITKMRFYVTTPIATIKLKIWTGPEATEIYSQDVTDYNINSWTVITLDTPITIDASTQFWAGLNIDMPTAGAVMGCDEGPAISNYGDLYRFNNVWYNGGLNWNIQIQIKEPVLPTYLHWDNGVNYTTFGNFLQPFVMDFASKWDPDHIAAYDGWTVTKMRFYLSNPTATVKLKIWSGLDATEIYSQDVTSFNVNDWTEITLDSPVTIDASTQFWAGLNVDMPTAGDVMGCDEGPAIDGYGDMYRFNGNWYHDFDYNWNIQFEVDNLDGKAIDGLLGYNIFRDNVQLNENTWGGISFIDENLLNGTYNYYVTAVYDEGESDPSNTVEVIIAQPVIAYADSMALVDLYNSCNGPNWAVNDLWLEGPVNEWYGVGTTGTRVTSLWRQSNNLTGDIPASIGDLTALEELHLEANQITSIPESVGNLTALTELWLGWTPITNIPESIGNLINLKQLHLGQMVNPLGTLPDEICNLESLEWFALGSSGLNNLPENFGNLTSVTSLFLQLNNLTELPAGFGGMESLDYLTLNGNQLTTLPDSFGNLDNLSQLFIEENQLTHFPESFGDLESLEIFWGRFNQINSLPESFGNLDALNFLRLGNNSLTELPESFSDMAAIEILFLNNNQINALPEDFGNLETLEIVELGANNISEIPESIGNLSQMSVFAIMDNNLSGLPETMGDIAPDSLFIHNNHIAEIPESMFDNTYDLFVVLNNNLQFGSIEPFMDNGIDVFVYAPQEMIGQDTTIEVILNETLEYTIEVSGENNIYKWYKDGTLLPDQTSNNLYIENASSTDQGVYVLKVTNTTVADLELSSYDVTVNYITGIDDVEIIDFEMYPNPVSGNTINISIDNPQTIEGLMIINGSGQIVMTEMMKNQNNIINISGLPKGIYIVKVTYVDGLSQMEKLIVR